jgi:hypothetical protein
MWRAEAQRRADPMSERIRGYRAFWPHYVGEHRLPATRRLHFVGTSGAIALVILAGALGEPYLLLAALVCGYFFAWLSHLLVERNRPATFTYPLFSLVGDFHMYGLMWLGRMDAEVIRLAASGDRRQELGQPTP